MFGCAPNAGSGVTAGFGSSPPPQPLTSASARGRQRDRRGDGGATRYLLHARRVAEKARVAGRRRTAPCAVTVGRVGKLVAQRLLGDLDLERRLGVVAHRDLAGAERDADHAGCRRRCRRARRSAATSSPSLPPPVVKVSWPVGAPRQSAPAQSISWSSSRPSSATTGCVGRVVGEVVELVRVGVHVVELALGLRPARVLPLGVQVARGAHAEDRRAGVGLEQDRPAASRARGW